MNSFKELGDSGCGAQGGNDNFGGFGSSSFRPGRSFSSHRDRRQDVPSSSKSIGNYQASGNTRGIVRVSLNGDMDGRFEERIEGIPRLLGCLGSFGNLGNMGLSFPFSVQFRDRTI